MSRNAGRPEARPGGLAGVESGRTRRRGPRLKALLDKRVVTAAGLMSGTSADGTDVCIVRLWDGQARRDASEGRGLPRDGAGTLRARVIGHGVVPHPPELARALLRLAEPRARTDVDLLARAHFALGEAFARALLTMMRRCGLAPGTVDLVGSHGQTVRHRPRARPLAGLEARATLQIGETSVIAQRMGCVVVGDFRSRDVAAGGEGAPLVPHVDRLLFAQEDLTVACQNIGGIGNVTYLPSLAATRGGARPVAFDTGPGNMLIDAMTRRVTRGARAYDRGGAIARDGRAHPALLAWLLGHPFLRLPVPRSAGREEFGQALAEKLLSRASRAGVRGADLVATATAFTVASIARAYRRHLSPFPQRVIVSGGGALNRTLMEGLSRELAPAGVTTSAAQGVPVQAKEALAFAILAYETIRGRPSGCPWATGARESVVLGKIVP